MISYFIKDKINKESQIDFKWKYVNKIIESFSYIRNNNKAKKELIENIELTLNHVSLPNSNHRRSILVVGKVQSGKTTNFSCLSAGFIDMGYDIIIILGGTNNTLLSQNLKRAKESFKDNQIYIFDNNQLKNLDPLVIQAYLEKGYKIILCIMKEFSHLKNLIKVFDGSSLYYKCIAIIDDEGDLASLSNISNVKKAINEKLRILSQKIFATSTYVSYTATPQGNLLIPKKSWQSPDFINYIQPNDNLYCGLKAYHSKNSNKIVEIEEGFSDLEVAIKRAIYIYVLHLIDSDFKSKFDLEMIIHSARINENHEKIYSYVNDILNKILSLPIKNIIKSSKAEFNYNIEIDEKNLNKLNHYLLSNIFVQRLFGKENKKLDKQKNTSLIIYIGGDMLGRGVTFFPVVTYLTRTANIFFMDALLQRARWFGYRKNQKIIGDKSLFDISRVYMETRNKRAFESILNNDRSIWNCIRVSTDFMVKPKTVIIPLISDDISLLPTNKEKLSIFSKPKKIKGLYSFDFLISEKQIFNKTISLYDLYSHINRNNNDVINKYFELIAIAYFLNLDSVDIDSKGLIYLNIERELFVYGR